MQVLVPDYLVEYLQPLLQVSDPELDIIPINARGEYSRSLAEVRVLYKFYLSFRSGPDYGPEVLRRILMEAPALRWIHSGKAGVEDLLIDELVQSNIVLTNGAGAPKVPVAETVLAYILSDAKELAAHAANQRLGRWKHLEHRELRGMTVAILGLGNIGLEVARLCHALGMHVVGTKLRLPKEPLPCVDELFPSSRQSECLARADYVVVAAALTPATRHMVNARALEAMKPEAAIINVGRGGLVDQPAIIEALRDGRLRQAYLDAVEPEPLPEDSPLWTMPNVLITPHNSASSQRLTENMARIFVENFARYCAGEPLVNVVDKRKGY